jgi:hypothetical protein
MPLLQAHSWEIATGLAIVVVLTVLVLWLILRKRLTPEEIERARRQMLAQTGRLVDGMLLDVYELEAEDGRTLTMLLFNYRIGGVDYECSQNITGMGDVVNPEEIYAGFPCSVRYQPGNPHNSIVLAEEWSGLRVGLPAPPRYSQPKPYKSSYLHSYSHKQDRPD